MSAAVNRQRNACDEGGSVGGEEADRVRHLPHLANAAHGVCLAPVLQELRGRGDRKI